ncbi:MAG: phosphotransferase, partial [Candidatus Eremiobacteraeota bacterium]|nr:phosphotransferase [Candidatus Eremiobacteraeota bacterium]
MRSSPMSSQADLEPELRARAARLCGGPIVALEPAASGGNNRVFRVRTAAATFALKRYRISPDDPRDRLGAELAGLGYAGAVAPGSVPAIVGADREAGLGLYEWIEGDPVGAGGPAEVDAALALVGALHAGRPRDAQRALPIASEAILG